MSDSKKVLKEMHDLLKLSGIGPRYPLTEKAPIQHGAQSGTPTKDKAHAGLPNVASKEYAGPPDASKEGGYRDAGGVNTQAKAGGIEQGPGVNNLMKPAGGASKEGGYIDKGGVNTTPKAGGVEHGPGQNKKTKRAGGASKEGGYVDAGGGAKVAKAGGASPDEANKGSKDDEEAETYEEYRLARNQAMRALISECDAE